MRNQPTDEWRIGVEFDESSLLKRERRILARAARVARAGDCDEGKRNDRPEERSFTGGIRVSIHIPFFL